MFLTKFAYPYISLVVTTAFLIFLAALILRLIFNYTDPNPFGKIGRFSYHLKKRTDRFVYPAARFLANFRVDTRLAPILTALIAGVLTYFALNVIWKSFWIFEKLGEASRTGNITTFVGIVIYALLDVLILFIFIRFISAWFVFTRNTFLGFVTRVTNPILLPAQRLIPPVGMFDLSAMVVLIVIWLLQTVVIRAFGIA